MIFVSHNGDVSPQR